MINKIPSPDLLRHLPEEDRDALLSAQAHDAHVAHQAHTAEMAVLDDRREQHTQAGREAADAAYARHETHVAHVAHEAHRAHAAEMAALDDRREQHTQAGREAADAAYARHETHVAHVAHEAHQAHAAEMAAVDDRREQHTQAARETADAEAARRAQVHDGPGPNLPPNPSPEQAPGGAHQNDYDPDKFDNNPLDQTINYLNGLASEAFSGSAAGASYVVDAAEKAKDLVTVENMKKLSRFGTVMSFVMDGVDTENAFVSALNQEGHLDGAVFDHASRTLVGDMGGELGSYALGYAGASLGGELAGPPGAVAGTIGGSYFGGQWGKETALNFYDWVRTHT